MPVTSIDHVQLAMPPGGEAEARAFYEGLLGIPEVPKPPLIEPPPPAQRLISPHASPHAFPPADSSIPSIFPTEDAAVVCSRERLTWDQKVYHKHPHLA